MFLNELMHEIDVSAVVTYEENGLSTLEFSLPSDHELVDRLLPETEVTYNNVYKIQTLHDYDDSIEFTCGLKLFDLKSDLISFLETEKNIAFYLNKILENTTWKIENKSKTKNKRTIELQNVYRIDALQEVQSVFDVFMQFDNIQRIVIVTDIEDFENKGKYISDQVNCLSIDYQADSNNIATRIYGYGGKDALDQVITVESINDGKPYVENFDYTDEVIEYTFTDERFTNKQNLLLEMQKRLKVMSKPTESYDIKVIDLAKCADIYKPLKLNLHELVSLYDRKRNRVVEHRIVKYEEHIGSPEEDIVTLNCVLPTPESVLNDTNKQIEIIQNINENVQQDLQRVESAMYYFTNESEYTISTNQKQFSSFEFKTSGSSNLMLFVSFNIIGTGTVEANIYIDDTLMLFKPKANIVNNGVLSFSYPTIQMDSGVSHFLEVRVIADVQMTLEKEQGHVVLFGQKLVGGMSDSRPHAEVTEFIYYEPFSKQSIRISDAASGIVLSNKLDSHLLQIVTDYMMRDATMTGITESIIVDVKVLMYIFSFANSEFIDERNYVLDGSLYYQKEDIIINAEDVIQESDYVVKSIIYPDSDVFYCIGNGVIQYE